MKTLKDNISVHPTRRTAIDDFNSQVTVNVSRGSEPARSQYGMGLVEEHTVEVRIGTRFCCNHAELSMAESAARKRLINALYQEQHMYLDLLLGAVGSGNRKEAYEVIDKLRQSMTA